MTQTTKTTPCFIMYSSCSSLPTNEHCASFPTPQTERNHKAMSPPRSSINALVMVPPNSSSISISSTTSKLLLGMKPASNRTATTAKHRCVNKRVSFNVSHNKEYQIKHVLNEIDNAQDIWYVKSEYKEIRALNKATYELLRHGYPERLDFCYRGLEFKRNIRNRNRRMQDAEDIVMIYQEQGNDAHELAEQYAARTRPCQKEAYQMGIADAKVAKAILLPHAIDTTPRVPRRTWARAC
jgi:hypothetical protein